MTLLMSLVTADGALTDGVAHLTEALKAKGYDLRVKIDRDTSYCGDVTWRIWIVGDANPFAPTDITGMKLFRGTRIGNVFGEVVVAIAALAPRNAYDAWFDLDQSRFDAKPAPAAPALEPAG